MVVPPHPPPHTHWSRVGHVPMAPQCFAHARLRSTHLTHPWPTKIQSLVCVFCCFALTECPLFATPDSKQPTGLTEIQLRQIKTIQSAEAALKHDAEVAFRDAAGLLDDTSGMPPSVEAHVCWIAGAALTRLARTEEAMSYLSHGVELCRKHPSDKRLRRLLRYVAVAEFNRNNFREAKVAAEEACELTRKLNGEQEDAYHIYLLNTLGGCETELGNINAAIFVFSKALKLSKVHQQWNLQTMILANLADLYRRLGRFEEAKDYCLECIKVASSQGLVELEATAHETLGQVYLAGDQLDDAHTQFSWVLTFERSEQTLPLMISARNGLATIAECHGDLLGTRKLLLAARDDAAEIADSESVANFEDRIKHLGKLTLEQKLVRALKSKGRASSTGDFESAVRYAEEASKLLVDLGRSEEAVAEQEQLREYEKKIWNATTSQAVADLQNTVEALQDEREIADLRHHQQQSRVAKARAEERLAAFIGLSLLLGLCLTVTIMSLVWIRRSISRERQAAALIKEQKEKQKQLELRMANEEKVSSLKILAGGLVHDFNNLLAAIATSAECGQIVADDNARQQSFQRISEATAQASQLTGQLVQYLGGSTDSRSRADLGEITAEMEPLLQTIVNRRASLVVSVKARGRFSSIDESESRQILVNLVCNAAESTAGRSGGHISVDIQAVTLSSEQVRDLVPHQPLSSPELPAGEYCQLAVSDNGCGMDDVTLSRVFDPYFSTKKSGHGLGMASVLGIVKARGGGAVIESTQGIGTTVRIYLPLTISEQVEGEGVPSQRVHVLENRIPEDDAKRVLVVEDEELVRESIRLLLTSVGCSVDDAANAEEARSILNQESKTYDSVISDYSMPGENGRSFLAWVKKSNPGVVTVLCSGLPEDANPDPSKVDAVVPKPFSREALIAAIWQNRKPDPERMQENHDAMA